MPGKVQLVLKQIQSFAFFLLLLLFCCRMTRGFSGTKLLVYHLNFEIKDAQRINQLLRCIVMTDYILLYKMAV